MARDKTARLRMAYTGEPYSSAFHWFRSRGLFNGLVPDAGTAEQQLLEAMVLRALVRPAASSLAPLASHGTVYGLEGATPDVDRLLLRPAGDLVAPVLARILPSASAVGVVGVPGLRVHLSPRTGLAVGQLTGRAEVEILPSRHRSAAAASDDLSAAVRLAERAGLTPLWNRPDLADGEGNAWRRLNEPQVDVAVWSTALRRIGLFIQQAPDWGERDPDPVELQGPKPERIRPRPVGPKTRARGVVAVASGDGRGGRGCTTAVLVLAGAFARSGAAVGVLAVEDDPNSLLARLLQTPAQQDWHPVPAPENGGRVAARAVPTDGDLAGAVAQARERFDVVLIDYGNDFQLPQALGLADVVVALAAQDKAVWSGRQLVDRRPDDVRFTAWLEEEYTRFRCVARPLDPLEKLLTFLDDEFAFYVMDREDHGDPAVYDPSDTSDMNDWWEGYEHTTPPSLDDDVPDDVDPEDDSLMLPAEDEAIHLDRWRADFLAFLADEGSRRHGPLWAAAVAQWAARSKDRNRRGLRPGELDADPFKSFATAVEDEAVRQWGAQMWQRAFPVWAASRQAGDDLLAPWADLVEVVTVPLDPDAITTDLRSQLRSLPDVPTVLVLSRADPMTSHKVLAAVRDRLMDEGFAGFVALPDLRALTRVMHDVGQLAERGGEAAVAETRLARVVATALGEAGPGTHSGR